MTDDQDGYLGVELATSRTVTQTNRRPLNGRSRSSELPKLVTHGSWLSAASADVVQSQTFELSRL
jgi:hypothetical protein